jgi:hypothetical protein
MNGEQISSASKAGDNPILKSLQKGLCQENK